MRHSPDALFVMVGAGAGILEGRPDIAGIPRLVAAALGVEPHPLWPDAGLKDLLVR